jgi:Ca2+-transporting ATPase
MNHPHALDTKLILKELATDEKKGLSPQKRLSLLSKHGKNVLPSAPKPTLWSKIFEQLKNPIVILLLITATIAGATGKAFDAGLIYAIVLAMAGIGVYLEQQSEKSLSKLESLQAKVATILIDGKPTEVLAEDLVIGDILLIHEGDTIAADGRIIFAQNFHTDEAALTGESFPISKSTKSLPAETTLGDRVNMVFAGTACVDGTAKVVVTHTGSNSELGKITQFINQAEKSETPLQKELEKVGKFLLIATLVSVSIILSIYLYRRADFLESLLTTTSLAIAFVPEGLSAVLTVTLALAVKEMVRKKVIVKRLLAAEGLGSITHLASDKTGTMTEGKMQVVRVYLGNKEYSVTDEDWLKEPTAKKLLQVVQFCNNNKGPTEQALISFIEKHHLSFEISSRRFEHRFTSELKRMSVIHEHDGQLHLYSKGAPEILIPLCTEHHGSKNKQFDPKEKKAALKVAEKLASQGYRVLALADKKHKDKPNEESRERDESQLCFIGLIALMDPLRPTVAETVEGFYRAGIKPMMITGDHPAIATYIAQEAKIVPEGTTHTSDYVLTGDQLDKILPYSAVEENQIKLNKAQVFARVKPEHKLQLVHFYQTQGSRIAMTGDGVNDAAAIKKADVGIAMDNGAGLTKDIADVVITGTYDALLRAVSVGRTVLLRTQLYLHYLLSGNSCQVGLFFLAVIFNWPIPLTSVMLLLINLLTDALPAMAMAVEPEDPKVINKKSSQNSHSIMTGEIYRGIVVQAILSTVLLGGVYALLLPQGAEVARTAVFTLYLFQKAFRGFTARSFSKSVLEYGFFTNQLMNVALLIVAVAWVVMTQVVPSIFGMVQPDTKTILILLVLGLIPPVVEEMTKYWNKKSPGYLMSVSR